MHPTSTKAKRTYLAEFDEVCFQMFALGPKRPGSQEEKEGRKALYSRTCDDPILTEVFNLWWVHRGNVDKSVYVNARLFVLRKLAQAKSLVHPGF